MILTRAPLRVPLGGGGTDFPSFFNEFGGYILGFAISKYVYVVIHPTMDKKYHLKYSKTESVDNLDLLENRVAAECLEYFKIQPGLEISTFSDVPESSGLGGSSSFCVALVTALRTYLGDSLDPNKIFNDAYDIERNKAKQPGGFQDQWFASFGGAHEIFFSDTYSSSRCVNNWIKELISHLRLVYVGTSSRRLNIASNQNEKTKSKEPQMISGLLTVKNIGEKIGKALEEKDYDKIGKLFNEHWESKKSRDPNITTPEIDSIYSSGLKLGALGGKVIGMGGGGYILFCGPNLDGRLPSVDLSLDTEGAKVIYQG
jgi:D-glycero-alpha-D-manno-heptose-7-phosphate kinase